MVEQIREKRNEVSGPILVVTGGFHSSALAALTEDYLCPGIEPIEAAPEAPPPAPLDDVGIALTTYSYERLDNLKGYNSGLPNPGFYENAWRQRQAGQGFCHTALLRELVRELRNRKQTLSTADLIAVETSARGLASLRGRGHVWRSDLVDAVTSALIKDELEFGCQSPFLDAVHAVLRGNRRGRLAEGTRMPPLVVDIRQLLESFGMEPSPATREVTLDLLSPDDVSRSRLLHRLKLIGVIGYERVAGTDFLHRDDLKQLWEKWSIRWSPEFEGSCVEASRYGTSLTEAASARLSEMADQMQCDAAVAAALLVQAAQAGVETISASLLEQLETLIEAESGFAEASKALEHLLFLYCYDEAFGTSRLSEVGRLLVTTFSRTLWVLESLGQSAGDERQALRGMKALLETWQRTGGVLRLDAGEFAAVLQRVESDPRKPPSLRGAAAGILWTLGMANDEQILADLLMFAAPANLGDFLAGLFTVAREVAQRHQKLVQTIDRLLMEFGADDFQASLPSMRLAFTYYTPREKHHMLTTLFEALGLKEARPLAPLVVDHLTAAEALRLEERMFELISRYGLEAPHE